ncbi:ABC-type glycerol-3-phosphate transport system substrate-binding protein [Peptoniphilus ivorii]|uniref:hypothetical protein n=1 Tax=Aedoeadaptatus ivorii TaxID=54006 RepID=UPI0027896E8D|nr:hypothetical protein [Peptoniphilus ivorii]MDQ0508511.1 ABC-type glycerol-3-phosphate transport system substrate-binding protein [Peptoniphilus ivorii]
MKKVMRLASMLLAAVFLLAGCGGDATAPAENAPAEEGSATDGTEITLMIPDWGAPTEEMLAEFKARPA